MEKIKFKSARLGEDVYYKEVEGSIIKIKGIEFYCYKDEEHKKNYVVDMNTGLALNTSYKTKKEAVESAESNFEKYINLTKTDKYKKFKEDYERNC